MNALQTVLLGTVLIASPAMAQSDQDASRAESLVKAFVGACMQAMPDTDRVQAGAKAAAWKELTGDMARMLAPPEPSAKWKAWLVEGAADVPFMLAVSKNTDKGKEVSVCTVMNPYAPAEPVARALISFLNLSTSIKTEVSAGQKWTHWQTQIHGKEAFVTLIDATPMKDPGINVSVMMIQ